MVILTVAAGLLIFGVSFGLSFLRGKKAAELAAQLQAQAKAEAAKTDETLSTKPLTDKSVTLSLTEKQLEGLIHDVREKMREYNNKTKQLADTEQRVRIAQAQLKKDIDSLTELRTELASTVAALKQERDALLKSRIEIKESEVRNLTNIAATYDKMNATGAAEIFTSMSKLDTEHSTGLNDVTKILYYMNDRTKAKVLAELVNTEPKLAAVLSQQLKRIQEVPQ
jgi:hypothetical protein